MVGQNGNHELELKVNLVVFSAPLSGWADDEDENGNGEMMATITEISILNKLGQCEAKL